MGSVTIVKFSRAFCNKPVSQDDQMYIKALIRSL